MMQKHELDVLGEVCPVPLLKTQKKMEELKQGETLIVHTDFTRSVRNIMDMAVKKGYPIQIEEVGSGAWQITLTK